MLARGTTQIDIFARLSHNAIVTIIGQEVLQRAVRSNVSLRKWLSLWAATVELRIWHDLQELRRDYPTADGVKLKSRLVVTVFNVKGNEYRLLTWVDYSAQIVEVLEVLKQRNTIKMVHPADA